jgi:hypothetical protein
VKHNILKPVLCITPMLVLGFGLMTFGWDRTKTNLQLDQRNASIEGKVIDGYITTGMRQGQWSHLVVEYQPVNHALIKREFDVDSRTYKEALETGKVTVTYLPDDPQVGRVTRFDPLPFQLLIGIGGLILLCGLICLASFIAARTKTTDANQSV